MKKWMLILFFVPLFTHAQKTHTVAAKESLYSLGRLYRIPPKELASYNNISIETGLNIGQILKIPSKATNASANSNLPLKSEPVVKKVETAGAALEPIYHKVEKKETLYRISKLYKNCSVDEIKKWNHLTGDGLTEGTNLIVGYQKAKKRAVISPVVITDVSEPKTVKPEPVKQILPKEKKTIVEQPVAIVETKIATHSKPAEPAKETSNKTTGKNFNGGYFKTLYNEQSQKKSMVEETGTAAIFKSTSGWEDGKYYCLHNTAPAGSFIKITNRSTQKSVYAKVLDIIPDLKQNTGIMIRLSNAAADELGAGENNFDSIVSY
ncbi:MAG: LysM peptidoglycan-binding domain-containing protein [Ferruginibacter sp.]|nr:LysM peptidoglycan-binding domain-containing protein [Ferruginibacter sp.]